MIRFHFCLIVIVTILQFTNCSVIKRSPQAEQWGMNPFFGGFPGFGGGRGVNPMCPGGYYCANVDSKVICPEGFYCPPGSQARTPCPQGMYARQGATQCKVCPPGYVCPQTGSGTSTVGAVSPTKCAAGVYCPPGTATGIACPQGAYCNNENAPDYQPIPCPAGSYTDGASKTQPTDCLTCPPGTSSEAGASACRATTGTGTGINNGNGFNNGFPYNGFPNNGFPYNGFNPNGYGGFNGFNPFFG